MRTATEMLSKSEITRKGRDGNAHSTPPRPRHLPQNCQKNYLVASAPRPAPTRPCDLSKSLCPIKPAFTHTASASRL